MCQNNGARWTFGLIVQRKYGHRGGLNGGWGGRGGVGAYGYWGGLIGGDKSEPVWLLSQNKFRTITRAITAV